MGVSEGYVKVDMGESEGHVEVDAGVSEGHVEVDVGGEGDNEDDKIQESVSEGRVDVDGAEKGDCEEREGDDEDDFDVNSWNESVGDTLNEEDPVDVSIHNDKDKDNSWKGNEHMDVEVGIGQVDLSGPSGDHSHVHNRGLFDTEWESESLNSVEYSDSSGHDRDSYGKFGIISMPKSMED